MDSHQDMASLPDALNQISLDRDELATTTSTAVRDLPALLNIPLEIRQSIYQYFLKADKHAKADDFSCLPHFDLGILHLNRQLRFEAMKYLAKNNMWVELSVPLEYKADLCHYIWAAPQVPHHILPLNERNTLLLEKSISITLSEIAKPDRTDQLKQVEKHIVFAYSIASYAMISEAMVRMRRIRELALSIAVAPKYSDRNHTIIEDLILPFMVARDTLAVPVPIITGLLNLRLTDELVSTMIQVNRCASHFQDHLLAINEEGNRFFAQGQLGAAGSYYNAALLIYTSFEHNYSQDSVSAIGEANVVRSIFTDILNNWVNTSNIMVARSRDAHGTLRMHTISAILDTHKTARHLFDWVGMSDQQRQKAHYRSAVAAQNLAEYCAIPEHLNHLHMHHAEDPIIHDVESGFLYRVATRQYYCAWKADVHSRSAPYLEGLYHELQDSRNCLSEEPEMIIIRSIPGYGNGTWEGDLSLIKRRTPDEMRRDLQLSVPREDKTMTKEELKQMKKDLGMPGDQLDGLVRLLRPE